MRFYSITILWLIVLGLSAEERPDMTPVVVDGEVRPQVIDLKRKSIANELPVTKGLELSKLSKASLGDVVYYGLDSGEFGGGVCMKTPRGIEWLMRDPVQALHKSGDAIFVVAGLAHLSLEYGVLYEVGLNGKAQLLTYMPQAPLTSCIGRDSHGVAIYVVTRGLVYSVGQDGGKIVFEIITKDDRIGGLFPNSCIWYKDKLFIGGLGAIYTIRDGAVVEYGK